MVVLLYRDKLPSFDSRLLHISKSVPQLIENLPGNKHTLFTFVSLAQKGQALPSKMQRCPTRDRCWDFDPQSTAVSLWRPLKATLESYDVNKLSCHRANSCFSNFDIAGYCRFWGLESCVVFSYSKCLLFLFWCT
jgi:hypothetical protein